ncbi:MAG TPA: CHASE3 domain-containing protein [Terracidiphilus sp.]|nr:CHASE3 domain-containing protein [Terracidiphilus sp.]
MQTRFKRFSVIAAFALLLAVLIVNAAITKRQLDRQVATGLWVAHTHQVQLKLSETLALLTDAETGQRGFLYTGEERYLAPYNLAIRQIQSRIDELSRLTADNPSQRAAIRQLRSLAREKLNELAATIALYRSGKVDDARKLVLSDAGLRTMENIRTVVALMDEEESRLESDRDASYRATIRLTSICIYLTTVIAAFGLVLLAFFILRQMNLRERHTREIHAREEWFRVTLKSIGDAVIATDQNGHVTFLNPVAEGLTGISTAEAMGKSILEVFPIFHESTMAPVDSPVVRVIAEGRAMGLANHTVLRRADGTLTPIDDSAAPIRDDSGNLIGVVLVFRDITSDRKTERVLRNTEKLNAAARLSATVAHEINNPLEAAVNLVYLVRMTPALPEDTVRQLAQAEQELERVAHLTRQTLGFFRDKNAPGPVQMEALVESVLRIYSNKMRSKRITIHRRFEECPPIRGVENEIMQVVSNLISNAADAAATGGVVAITLKCLEEAGKSTVYMKVEDDGPGVADEHKDRIFEPFFTTKQDVGTGLGLWVSREIIERHGGTIQLVKREDGAQGAAFSVAFEAARRSM